jgi:hypothetical protein
VFEPSMPNLAPSKHTCQARRSIACTWFEWIIAIVHKLLQMMCHRCCCYPYTRESALKTIQFEARAVHWNYKERQRMIPKYILPV